MKQNIDAQAHSSLHVVPLSRTRHTARRRTLRIDGPWEIGICSTQGKQTGLDEATAMVASGTPLVEVARTFP